MPGACSWEPKTRPVMHDLDPEAFPRLYRIAHFEMKMYKSNNSASGFAGSRKARFSAAVVSSDLSKQHKSDNDDQDGADDTDTPVFVAVTVAAEAATEAAEQKNNENDNDDDPHRHGLISGCIKVRSLMVISRYGRSIRSFLARGAGYLDANSEPMRQRFDDGGASQAGTSAGPMSALEKMRNRLMPNCALTTVQNGSRVGYAPMTALGMSAFQRIAAELMRYGKLSPRAL
jgi:hypothetical protein